jgi:hypothetical protein
MATDLKYPNSNLYVLILAAEEVIGKNGLASIFHQSKLSFLVGKYPPNDMKMEVPFSLYGHIQQAIEEFYGQRGARAILMRVGRALFRYSLHEQTAAMGLASLGLKALPQATRQKLILGKIVGAANEHFNMPTELVENDDSFIMTRTVCPCQFRQRDPGAGPCDHVTIGTLQEALRWATGNEFRVTQSRCLNTGDAVDEFEISKTPQTD